MILPIGDYYVVQDINRQKANLKVVGEFTTRGEAEVVRDKLQVRGCEVYAEVGGKLYRVICEQTKITNRE
jgi:hypothetical protein